ncbi:DUF302 domain-containing protein [Labilibaculum euxinus]
MKNITIIASILLGFTLGILFTGITLSISSGEMMIKEFKSPYNFEKSVEIITNRINAKEGWHVTNTIDQNKEIIDNGGKGIGKYAIIKYCHAKFSERMLKEDNRKKIGNMMPKSFAVYEKADGQVFISTMNGAIMGKIFGGEIENIIEEVSLEVEDMMRFIHLKYSLF